jgi:hypothetical protein
VDLLGPYNEYLLTDVGGFYLGFALLLTWAGVTLHREFVRPASAAAALTAGLRLAFHSAQLNGFSTVQTVLQTAGLVVLLALPVATFALARSDSSRRRRTGEAFARR